MIYERFIIFLIAIGVYNLASVVQGANSIDERKDACISQDPSAAGMTKCNNEARRHWMAEMDKYYSLLMKRLDKDAKDKLKESQTAWKESRDTQLKAIDNSHSKKTDMHANVKAVVYEQLVKERALQLKIYYETVQKLQQ
jgi:uncharacterized protein YecT (DUF1311 family)